MYRAVQRRLPVLDGSSGTIRIEIRSPALNDTDVGLLVSVQLVLLLPEIWHDTELAVVSFITVTVQLSPLPGALFTRTWN